MIKKELVEKIIVDRYWRDEKSGSFTPPIEILKCKCGKYPSYYSSCGGFNYYGYYKCNDCNLFATGRHQFPSAIANLVGENDRNEPKLFVVYNDEANPEDGWNELIKTSYTI